MIESITRFANLLEQAHDALEEIDQAEADALLTQWWKHSRDWVKPYRGQWTGGGPDVPAFHPTWRDLLAWECDSYQLMFERYQFGEDDRVEISLEYFQDPDGWIERDKTGKVSRRTWEAQRDRAIKAERQTSDEKLAATLAAKGWKVEKP